MSETDLAPKPDEVQLFMLYALFGGDEARTAVVANTSVDLVRSLAHDYNWKGKLSGRMRLDTDEGKEHERALNRVAVYTTATRLERVFSNVIGALDGDPMFARAFCTTIDEEGKKSYSTKNLVELAKGLETVANIKYRALGDKLAENADTTGGPERVTNVAISIYRSLSARFDAHPVIDTAVEVSRAVSEPSRVQAADATAGAQT